ncbi:MAG TPA: ATP-binding protein, partial [Thermodesulfobium narugense]|nr:ATP-binding protein [Thermodesulfobium narugense]
MSDKAQEKGAGLLEPVILPNVKKVVAILSGK